MANDQAQADTETNNTNAVAPAGVAPKAEGNSDLAARIDAASTPEELARIQREFFESDESKQPVAEAADEVDAQADKSADASAESSDEASAGEQENETQSDQGSEAEEGASAEVLAAGDDEAAKAETDGDDASVEKGTQFRVRRKDPVEKRAMELMKRNIDLSMKEALAKAENEVLGDKAEVASSEGQKADDGLPKTMADAQTKLKELRAAKSKAMREELDLAKADELDLQMENIRDHMMVLQRQEVEEQTRAKQTYLQEFEGSQKKASSLYDFMTDEKHPGFDRAREIDEQMRESGDPTYRDPSKPLIIAQMVARELRIAPKSAKQPVASKSQVQPAAGQKPAAGSVPAKKPASVISSGGSRTVSQSNSGQQSGVKIDAIKSFDELRALGVQVD